MFVCLVSRLSEGDAFPGRQTLMVLVPFIPGRENAPLEQCVAVRMKNAWFLCHSSFSLRASHVCDISLHKHEERQKRFFPFHLLLLHHYDDASRPAGGRHGDGSSTRCGIAPLCVWMLTSCRHHLRWASRGLTGHVTHKQKPAYLIGSWGCLKFKVLRC